MRPRCLSRVKHGLRGWAPGAAALAAAMGAAVDAPSPVQRGGQPLPCGRRSSTQQLAPADSAASRARRHPAAAAAPRSGKGEQRLPRDALRTPHPRGAGPGARGQEARVRPGGNAAPCACRGASALSPASCRRAPGHAGRVRTRRGPIPCHGGGLHPKTIPGITDHNLGCFIVIWIRLTWMQIVWDFFASRLLSRSSQFLKGGHRLASRVGAPGPSGPSSSPPGPWPYGPLGGERRRDLLQRPALGGEAQPPFGRRRHQHQRGGRQIAPHDVAALPALDQPAEQRGPTTPPTAVPMA